MLFFGGGRIQMVFFFVFSLFLCSAAMSFFKIFACCFKIGSIFLFKLFFPLVTIKLNRLSEFCRLYSI